MKVQIVDEEDKVIWERGERGGITSLSYAEDGTIQKIIQMLRKALTQAEGEGLSSDDIQRVGNIGSGTSRQIENNIPMPGARSN